MQPPGFCPIPPHHTHLYRNLGGKTGGTDQDKTPPSQGAGFDTMFWILNIVYFLSTFFSDIRSRDQERQGKLLPLTPEVKYLQNSFTTRSFSCLHDFFSLILRLIYLCETDRK